MMVWLVGLTQDRVGKASGYSELNTQEDDESSKEEEQTTQSLQEEEEAGEWIGVGRSSTPSNMSDCLADDAAAADPLFG